MANQKRDIEVKAFADHHVITQPNPLRKVLRRVGDNDHDDPVARAEKALAGLSGEFKNWMAVEADRLSAAHAAVLSDGFTEETREELFRRVRRGQEFLHSNPSRDLNLTEIARQSCLSPYHFHRAFTRAFGKTPHQYRNDLRLAQARRLLERSLEIDPTFARACSSLSTTYVIAWRNRLCRYHAVG